MERFSEYIQELVVLFVIGISIFLGYNINYLFYLLPVPVIAVFLLFHKAKLKKLNTERLDYITNHWGKSFERKRKHDSIDALHKIFKEKSNEFSIDNTTWRDLNMDAVIKRIDHTMSAIGFQYLYNMLRFPIFNKIELENRKSDINKLQREPKLSSECRYELDKLGEEEIDGLLEYLYKGVSFNNRSVWEFRLLSASVFLLPLVFLVWPKLTIFLLILLLSRNVFIYNKVKTEIKHGMAIFKYIGRLIGCTENILNKNIALNFFDRQNIEETVQGLKKLNKRLRKMSLNRISGAKSIVRSDMEIVIDYFNMLVLREPLIFYEAVNFLQKHREEIKYLHEMMGMLDAYLSIASYRDSLEYFAEPVINDEQSAMCINCIDAYHPLLERPVPNSIEVKDLGALITGSNASGKSTFLRTIGINAIFSQTICTVLAKSYNASFVKVMTSIGTVDSILEGDSYFMAEAKSLKRIMDQLSIDIPVLCILDEIFRGTNTIERISGAASVLRYLASNKCCVLAATHDLELTRLAADIFKNYHFTEDVRENDIRFDYILHDGPCTSRNAILILKQLGYPEKVYDEAFKMASTY